MNHVTTQQKERGFGARAETRRAAEAGDERENSWQRALLEGRRGLFESTRHLTRSRGAASMETESSACHGRRRESESFGPFLTGGVFEREI